MDIRQHDSFDRRCLLLPWEANHADKIKYNYPFLQTACLCHVEERCGFKYTLMGIHFLLLLITTGNSLIASQIIDTLELGRLGLIAVYLPYTARCFISQCRLELEKMVSKYWISGLNTVRLRQQLQKSRFGLYKELLSLQPFENSHCIDTLEFLQTPLVHASFNPVFPLLALITARSIFSPILFVYCYGKGKRSRDIIAHRALPKESMIEEISWSPDGQLFYIITTKDLYRLLPKDREPVLMIFRLYKRKYTFTLLASYPLSTRIISSHLWLNNSSILYATPNDPNTYLSKLVIDLTDNEISKQPLSNLPTDPSPFTFPILGLFTDISRPVVPYGIPNVIYVSITNTYILQLSLTNKSLVTLYHLPGRLINMNTNGSLFLFTYTANSRHDTDVHTHVFDMSSKWTHAECNREDGGNGILVVGIVNKEHSLEYRILERE